jgi:hypothetical protein
MNATYGVYTEHGRSKKGVGWTNYEIQPTELHERSAREVMYHTVRRVMLDVKLSKYCKSDKKSFRMKALYMHRNFFCVQLSENATKPRPLVQFYND